MSHRRDAPGVPAWWERPALVTGVLGVAAYVATWFVLGIVRDGYDPLQQAISELFDLGAPVGQARLLQAVLVLVGAAQLPFAAVLDRRLPGRGPLGPLLVAVSGLGTLLVAFAPCTDGCPGVGASTTDTLHVVFAGGGYVALVTAPLPVAWRVRHLAPALARWSLVLGTLATVGFLVRNLGGVAVLEGLQQRVFNTLADLWLVVAAVHCLRAGAQPTGAGSTAGRTSSGVG